MIEKVCSKCGLSKSYEQFYKQYDSKDGYRAWCKTCMKDYSKVYTKEKYIRIYLPKNKPIPVEVQQNIDKKKKKTTNILDGFRERLYSITKDKFQQMLKIQDNKCPICKCTFNTENRNTSPCIDHDHSCCSGSKTCGKCVRALICFKCNMGLGFFEDNPSFLESAREYLTFPKSVL